MRILIILFAFASLFLFSCQKEVDFAARNTNGGGTTSGSMLVKTVAKSGTDSLVTLYTYNGNKKLINEKVTGTDQGNDINKEYRYYRNGAGIITHYVIISPDLISVGIDSITTVVHYNSSTSRYTSYVIRISITGFSFLDSSNFVYDASGKITREELYESPSGAGNDYYLSGKANYTYAANGNIAQLDIYDIDQAGTLSFVGTSKYSYDTKTSPIHLDNEAFAIGHTQWVSANNIISGQLIDSDPTNNQTLVTSYVYNSDNKPSTSISTISPDNVVINTAYYYQ